jgi:hypothetical protein
MLPALTLAAALSLVPAQPAASLNLTNLRSTYGLIGPTRPSAKYLPGDVVYLSFDVEGVNIPKDGKARYTLTTDVKDKAGKVRSQGDPVPRTDFAPLGGGKVPVVTFAALGVDMEAGEYTLKVTATDTSVADVSKQPTGSVEFKFEVLKPDLGIVGIQVTSDKGGSFPTTTTGYVGQFLWVRYSAVGFKRDPAKKNQPDLKFEMTTLDDKGEPTLATPLTDEVKALEGNLPIVTAWMYVPLTRAGKFTVRLKVTDNVAGKTATFDLPIRAVPVEK